MAPRDQPISDFVRTAKEYCRLIEKHPTLSCSTFLHRMKVLLPRLYASALSLPAVKNHAGFREPRRTQNEWQRLFKELTKKLGRHNGYWRMFDPYSNDKPMAGNLADDFTDIYGDIKPVVGAFAKGGKSRAEAAIWTCQFLLNAHWGRHATGALQALQELRSREEIK